MSDRLVSRRTYVLVCVALLILTGATIGLAHVDLRGWNPAVGLAIAATKAVLIALFFMDLRVGAALPRLVGAAALLWMGILIVGTLDDLLTRAWLTAAGR